MKFTFDVNRGIIPVRLEIWGPAGGALLTVALDTGATSTVLNPVRLEQVGYDPAASQERVPVTTGSRKETMARVTLSQIRALGQHRTQFPVLAHALPPSVGVDGVLGLDFLHERVLTIDFRLGMLELL